MSDKDHDVEVETTKALERRTTNTGMALAAERSSFALAELSEDQFVDLVNRATTHAKRMRRIVSELLEPGVHYGVPGESDKQKIKAAASSGKVGIYKAGAEMLLKIHRYVARVEYVVDYGDTANQTSPAITVRATATVYADNFDGPVMGVGVGACTSWETKYRYRSASKVCPECGKPTLRYQKAAAGGEYKGKPAYWCAPNRDGSPGGGCNANFAGDDPRITSRETGKIANADTYDQLNTFVKMAAKRARVDGAIAATGSSDILTQDVEDLPVTERERARREMVSAGADATVTEMYDEDPDGWREGMGAPANASTSPAPPAAAAKAPALASEKQVGLIVGLAKKKLGATDSETAFAKLHERFKVDPRKLPTVGKGSASELIETLKGLPDAPASKPPTTTLQTTEEGTVVDNEQNREVLRARLMETAEKIHAAFPGRKVVGVIDGIVYLTGGNECAILKFNDPQPLEYLTVDQLVAIGKVLRAELERKAA